MTMIIVLIHPFVGPHTHIVNSNLKNFVNDLIKHSTTISAKTLSTKYQITLHCYIFDPPVPLFLC